MTVSRARYKAVFSRPQAVVSCSRMRADERRAASRRLEPMEEFEGGFLRSLMIGFGLAILASFLFVWFG